MRTDRSASRGAPRAVLVALLAVLLLASWPGPLGPTPGGAPGAPRPLAPELTPAALPALPAGTGPAWRPAPPVSAPPHPLGVVDPFLARTSEPAPMGITDFGVTSGGTGTVGYTYSTPEWWADANISHLWANDGSNTSGHSSVGFQLNVVVKLSSPTAGEFAYWIQDVASLDTVVRGIGFVDNIWNMSSLAMDSGSVAGNGTVYQYSGLDYYADAPGCSGQPGGYPGNCVTLAYPAHLRMRVTTGVYAGVPHVTFAYNDGIGGWVTYDNASFPFAQGFTDVGFVVDGTQYTPIGIFYDAEFDYTGPSGSSTTMVDRNTAMQMRLEYWNGHNREAPTSAYNFGANTAEQLSNVEAQPLFEPGNGTLASNVTTGPGALGVLYGRSDVSVLVVTSPDSSGGTVTVGGTNHPFTGGLAELALAPGTYSVVLSNATGVVGSTNVTLVAGGTTRIAIGAPSQFPVTIHEQGLPAGRGWTVHLAGTTYPAAGPAVSVNLTNGTYGWSVDPVAGYTPAAYRGSITVNGTAVDLWVNFTVVTYPVSFEEAGLPAGTAWTLTLAGTAHPSMDARLVVPMPNGTFPFAVDGGPRFIADPGSGSVSVVGAPASVLIGFSLRPGYLTGSVSPSSATLVVDGASAPTAGGRFNLSLLPGVHIVAARLAGYADYSVNVTVSAGNATPLAIRLDALPPAAPGAGVDPMLLLVTAVGVGAAAVIGVAAVWGRRHR
jgi:Thermopsin